MPADRETRVGLRLGAALRSKVEAAGDVSSVVRALLIIGLHTAGSDVAPFVDDGAAALHRIGDPQLKSTLLRVLFNKSATEFQQYPREDVVAGEGDFIGTLTDFGTEV